ncbi:hypothetical protein AMELA_G00034060 [Ameiurus melas]|uniref:Fibrinogen C-terminal domain-containing protein n=1 Tax=Ameiurus melas TaxID=219545 RepID=A0A7J6B9U5_AMEME|nr:hypothetical protein AMELA_G00034060 [Ameiurus melas]
MWLSMLSLWGSLLTSVVSQSCPDPPEDSASWVRLKPLGQCKDGESTCPYRITIPPLTVQLPKSFRELEKMARELQSLTQMMNKLKEDCRECKERQGMDWNIQTDDKVKNVERVQASRGTLNTKERQQDIAKRESTVHVTTSKSAADDTMIFSINSKDVNPTAFGKQRNTSQERNVNPRTTNGGPKGTKLSQEKTISESMSKVRKGPSITTTKKKITWTPMAKLAESSFPGDLDSEQPTQHEKHKVNTIKAGHEMYPSGTLTAKGKVKSIPSTVAVEEEDDYVDNVETKQLQTPKDDKVLGEKQLLTGTDTQNNREHEPNMKQLTRKQQDKVDKKKVADTGQKSYIFDGNNNGNVAKEGSVSVIQQPTLKNKEKKEIDNHGASATKPKPLKPGAYSERDAESNPVNTDGTIRGQKKLTSPITGRANISVNVSQINPQTLEIKSKNPFKPDTDAKIGIDSKFNTAETVSGQVMSRSNISGIIYGIVDISPTNPQTLDSKKLLNTGIDSDSDAVMNSNPVNNVDTVSGVKNSKSPISHSVNATADVDLISAKKQSSNSKTSLKSRKNAEHNNRMDSNPINKIEAVTGQETSRSPISGITDVIVDASTTNLQILDSKNQSRTLTDSENDAVRDPKPVHNITTVSGLKNSRSSISNRANSTADVDIISPQSVNSQNPFTHGIDLKSNNGTDSHSFNTSETGSRLQMPKSPNSDITDAVEVNQTHPGTLDGTFKNTFNPGTDKERKAETDSNPLNKIGMNTALEMPQLPVTGRVVATVKVNQINPQMVYSNSENATVVSTPINKVETVSQLETPRSPISGRSHATTDQINPQAMDYIFKKTLKPGTISERKAGMYPYRDHTTDTVSQEETSESPISDSRHDVSGRNPSLNSNGELPKRHFDFIRNRNMMQPRNGQTESSNPMSIDTERKKALSNNKTTSLRSDVMTSGRHLPTGLFPKRKEKQQEITNQPERTNPTGIRLSKDPRDRKPYILQRIPINESKAFGSGGPKITSRVNDHTMTNGTTHVDSKTLSSHNNELKKTADDMSQSVRPTLATHGIVDQAHIKRAKVTPTVRVLHTMGNRQIKSTSQTTVTKPRLEKPGRSSGQDLILETVNNNGSYSQPSVVEKTKGTDRRAGKPPFRTSSVDSNQENHKKLLGEGSIQNPDGKVPLVVISSERNELNYTTTAATPYTTKTEFKNKHSKMPQFTPPITTPPQHFMDQVHVEQNKNTSGVKMSKKHVHHRIENPSQETESKSSHSDAGNKELQSASDGQESSAVTDLQPNSLDSIQNRAIGSMAIIMDMVKASTGSKVSSTSTESTNENRARNSNPFVMDTIEASTEVNQATLSLDNAPYTIEGNNRGHSIDNNNGNTYPVAVNRMTGSTLHKITGGHPNNGNNKEPVTVNNMDDRQGLEKQLLGNCHGQCDLEPTPWSILNSRESSNNNRDKPSQDCSDFIMRYPSGIYNVTPTGSGNRTFPVFCDMKSSGGGWTLIQHRFDGSISFSRTWNEYKRGFGNLTGEFWLGNDKIHWLTTTKAMILRIELEDLDGIKEYAQYDHFRVANESQYYRLTIEGYSGTAGDAMQYSKKFNHNQKNFTTPDRDNDKYTSGNCGDYYSSGWWFDACMAANLNGKYYETRYRGVRNGIFWGTWHNISTESYLTHDRQSFKTVRMMIRPRTELLMN